MQHTHETAAPWEPTFEPSCAARVLAIQGTWAHLWFPETDERLWVDLAEVEHEPVEAPPPALSYGT